MTATHLLAVLGVAGGTLLSSTGLATATTLKSTALSAGLINHVMVIDLENESYSSTFGPNSPATYLNGTLVKQGELIQNYYGTGHVSLDNYIAQVSGQAPNDATNSDCIGGAGSGTYQDLTPGGLDPNQTNYPGQVDGQGCVMPTNVATIGNQLDAAYPGTMGSNWREYAQDMGNDPSRDGGTSDPVGGTDCAHPVQVAGNGADNTNSAEGPNATGTQIKSSTTDQYANRHNPFIYFHSVTDNTAACNANIVPLGTVTVGTAGHSDTYGGHLANDLASEATTPRFSFITPNLCNDGHDATCAGTNTEGGTAGGLVAADLWLKHWMPLILNSPAYTSGHTMVVVTFDEGNPITDQAAGDHEQPGPNNPYPGYSPLLQPYYAASGVPLPTKPGDMPGGGQIGAVVLNPTYISPGTLNGTGSYNHYSALRTYEDLLGLTTAGSDGSGHLGFAATATSFGSDVFNAPPASVPETPLTIALPMGALAVGALIYARARHKRPAPANAT